MTESNEVVEGLKNIVGQAFVETEAGRVRDYAVDERVPRAVVFPGNTRDVSAVVRLAHRENLAIVPWGSGSKMAMGNRPGRLDLVVCTSRMNHMLDADTSNLTLTVEAGVKFRDIQARLATQEDRCYLPLKDLTSEAGEIICSERSHSGCFLPIDPSFSDTATIGGIIAANSSGPRRLLYNLPRDMILGVRVVAPNGDIAGAGGKTVKNVSAYDTSKLMVGSMGSLGIICEMTFKLLPLPEQMKTLLVSFETFSNASGFADRILASNLLPAAVEMMNGTTFASLSGPGVTGRDPGSYGVAVALETFDKAVDRMMTEIGAMARDCGAIRQESLDGETHPQFWRAVSHLEPFLAEKNPDLIKVKLNYPISKGKEVFEFVEKTVSENNMDTAIVSHAGSGVCYVYLLVAGDTESPDKVVRAVDQLAKLSVDVGGNRVIQRAPVRLKDRLNIWGATGSNFVIMKRIKAQIDPSGIMSPGRFVGGL